MSRGRRIISRGLDVVCILTIIVLPFFYYRQTSTTDMATFTWEMGLELGVTSETGLVTFYGISHSTEGGVHDGWGSGSWKHGSSEFNWWFVLGKYRRKVMPGTPAYQVGIPTWSLILVFAIKPAWSYAVLNRRRKRIAAGMCASCGYDLHGIDGDRCPECGTNQ